MDTKQGGFVVCGLRHSDCLHTISLIKDEKKQDYKNSSVQGFITDENRFLSREEAAIHAFNARQVKNIKAELFSEDLY